jgi:glutaredoxin 2
VFIDDVMILNADSSKFTTVVDIDTLRYTVAALGKNLTLGKVAIAPEILRRSILTPIDTISYPTTANQFGRNFAFDNANNIYIAGIGSVIKLDQTGKELANYTDTLDSISATMQNTGLNASDVNGDVYVFDTNTFQTRLTRLTSDLKFISKFIATDTDNSHRNASVALSNNGMLCQFGGLNTNTTSLFDSTLSIVRTVTISELITSAQIRNDTIFTLSFAGFKAYDMNFNELESWSVIDEITKYYAINSKPDIRTFKLSQSGIYAFAECFYPTVYFFDSNKNFLGRYALRGSIAGFDGTDRLYCDNGNGSLFRFKINY